MVIFLCVLLGLQVEEGIKKAVAAWYLYVGVSDGLNSSCSQASRSIKKIPPPERNAGIRICFLLLFLFVPFDLRYHWDCVARNLAKIHLYSEMFVRVASY